MYAVANGLPDSADIAREKLDEGHQPPLYYWIIGACVKGLGVSAKHMTWVRNPEFDSGTVRGHANIFDNAAVRQSNSGADIAKLHVLRFANAVIGALLFWWLWRAVAEIALDPTLALVAVSIWASSAQATWMGAVIGNDLLAALLSAVALFYWSRGLRRAAILDFAIVGAFLGLALLTKMTAAFLYAGICALSLHSLWRTRLHVGRFLAMMVIPLAVGGWSVLRSMTLHTAPHSPSLDVAWSEGAIRYVASWLFAVIRSLYTLLFSSIGLVGQSNILLPGWYYGLYLGVGAFIVVGIYRYDRRPCASAIPVAVWASALGACLFWIAGVSWFRASEHLLAGRFLYPFAAGFLALGVFGIAAARNRGVSPSWQGPLTALLVGATAIVAFLPQSLWIEAGESLVERAGFSRPASYYAELLSAVVTMAAVSALVVRLLSSRRGAEWIQKLRLPRVAFVVALVCFALNLLTLFGYVAPLYD